MCVFNYKCPKIKIFQIKSYHKLLFNKIIFKLLSYFWVIFWKFFCEYISLKSSNNSCSAQFSRSHIKVRRQFTAHKTKTNYLIIPCVINFIEIKFSACDTETHTRKSLKLIVAIFRLFYLLTFAGLPKIRAALLNNPQNSNPMWIFMR